MTDTSLYALCVADRVRRHEQRESTSRIVTSKENGQTTIISSVIQVNPPPVDPLFRPRLHAGTP